MASDSPQLTPMILAIDDETDILEIVKAALEGEGFVVQVRSDPREGIKYYQANTDQIALVLLDFIMPGMKGDAVFEQLQTINPAVRVLLLTACDDHVARTMFAKGLRGYMQKPFYLDDLIARVREEIEAPR